MSGGAQPECVEAMKGSPSTFHTLHGTRGRMAEEQHGTISPSETSEKPNQTQTMKLPNLITILAAFCLAAFTAASAGDANPGDRVAAKFSDGAWYLATATAARGAQIDVLYDDGDKATVPAADVIAIPRGTAFKTGDIVLAPWKTAQMFPGTVTAATRFTVTVKWDDGDEPLEIASDRVALMKAGFAAQAAPAGGLAAGTGVAAKWGAAGSFYIATITGITDTGKYRVEYGDGDKGDVAAADIVPVNAAREIEIGAHVLACWQGARMFPGVVTGRTGNSYTVKWDDGDTPLEVPREKIAPLAR